jgi:hypothetical protein
VLDSAKLSDYNLSVKVGLTSDNGWAQFLDLYGSNIRFFAPGATASGVGIDPASNSIFIKNGRNEGGLYLWDNSEDGWARLYVTNSGDLKYVDGAGNEFYLTQ